MTHEASTQRNDIEHMIADSELANFNLLQHHGESTQHKRCKSILARVYEARQYSAVAAAPRAALLLMVLHGQRHGLLEQDSRLGSLQPVSTRTKVRRNDEEVSVQVDA